MTNEAYRKCKTCRYCNHKDKMWVCVLTSSSTGPESTCERYRPGCCENCGSYSGGVCRRTGEEKYELDVCSDYDPSGSL
jgi:hypothetical protein